MVINMVIGSVIFELNNQYIENKSPSEFSTRVVSEITLEECLMVNDDFGFFGKLLLCVPYFCKIKTFFVDEWTQFQIV